MCIAFFLKLWNIDYDVVKGKVDEMREKRKEKKNSNADEINLNERERGRANGNQGGGMRSEKVGRSRSRT